MRIRLTLQPEQAGAKQLHTEYGERLMCVRYRYDAQRCKRFKTVELIIDESDWQPPGQRQGEDRLVRIRLAFPEEEMRRRVKSEGGRWDPQRRVWELQYQRVVALGLVERIVGEPSIY